METTEILAILTMIAVAGISLFAPTSISINEKPVQPSPAATPGEQNNTQQERMNFLNNYRQPVNVFDRRPPVGGKTRHAKKGASSKKEATRKHKK